MDGDQSSSSCASKSILSDSRFGDPLRLDDSQGADWGSLACCVLLGGSRLNWLPVSASLPFVSGPNPSCIGVVAVVVAV